jgi:hypothetical protein
MKYRRSTDYSDKHHLFLYSFPGAGKTKAARDYYEALGEGLVIVSNENRAEAIFDIKGYDVPILEPENQDELRAIISMPDVVVDKIVKEKMGYTFDKAHTFLFDNIRMTQIMIFGEGKRAGGKAFDGLIDIPPQEATGILALPNKRDFAGVPSNKDYRLLDMDMRKIVDKIDRMPYHTIVTTHAEEDYSMRTQLTLTGDKNKDKDVDRQFSGYPSLEGFSLKADLPGLVSDLFLYLYWDGNRYYVCFKPLKGWYARTTMAEIMPPQLDWTDKNMYEIIEGMKKKARGGK